MYIVNILGGLGNQMFQYAFAHSLIQEKKSVVKLDISSFETYDLREYELDLFNVSLEIATADECKSLKYKQENFLQKKIRKLRKMPNPLTSSYYKEHHFNFDEKVYTCGINSYFEGYWQSEKYFLKFREDLLQEFSLKNKLHSQSKEYQKKILLTESVSLHIRRGDYVSSSKTNSVHGTCDLEYYKKAVSDMQKNVQQPYFFIFSDDLPWAKENLDFIKNIIFVDIAEDIPDHEEIILMSQCQHNVIANSSFSWWGAWLNQNSEKLVIAPKKWFIDTSINTNDLIPPSWIRL